MTAPLPLILGGLTLSRYAVCSVCGCRIIHGEIPVADLSRLFSDASSSAVHDIPLARRLGATLVVGEPDDLAELAALLGPESPI